MGAGRTTGIGGVLLAAGGGSRFTGGQHKLLADIGGRPLVARALAAMAGSGLDRLAVVTGAVAITDLLPPGVVELANPRWADGQATSVAVATRWAEAEALDAVVIGLGDQPGITSSAWRAVAATDATPIAIATYAGRRGHPVRLAHTVWGLLPAGGDRGAAMLISGSPDLVTEVACEGDAHDIDTVEDLRGW